MSDRMKIGAVRASAIAAVNAVVRHKNLGLFVSEFEVYNHSLRGDVINNRRCTGVTISGRTNTNRRVSMSTIVVSPQEENDVRNTFPVERVFVWAFLMDRRLNYLACLDCYFDSNE